MSKKSSKAVVPTAPAAPVIPTIPVVSDTVSTTTPVAAITAPVTPVAATTTSVTPTPTAAADPAPVAAPAAPVADSIPAPAKKTRKAKKAVKKNAKKVAKKSVAKKGIKLGKVAKKAAKKADKKTAKTKKTAKKVAAPVATKKGPYIPEGSQNGHAISKKRDLTNDEKSIIRRTFLRKNGVIGNDDTLKIMESLGKGLCTFQVVGVINGFHRQAAKGTLTLRDKASYDAHMDGRRRLWATYKSPRYFKLKRDIKKLDAQKAAAAAVPVTSPAPVVDPSAAAPVSAVA